jgi:hypothetical protein
VLRLAAVSGVNINSEHIQTRDKKLLDGQKNRELNRDVPQRSNNNMTGERNGREMLWV